MSKQRLSYGKLLTRMKYYQDKVLVLEREFDVAEEELTKWKAECEQLQKTLEHQQASLQQNEQAIADYEKSFEKINENNELISSLQAELETLRKEYEEEQHKCEAAHKQLEESTAKLQSLEENYQNKEQETASLQEELLTTKNTLSQLEQTLVEQQEEANAADDELFGRLEEEINEKEEQLNLYKQKFQKLEQQIKYEQNRKVGAASLADSDTVERKEGIEINAYFQYSVIAQEEKFIIHGNLVITNSGTVSLHDPAVCLRILPEQFATIKGAFLSVEDASRAQASVAKWMLVESEWEEKAKETGEMWLQLVTPISLPPEETIVLEGFQIPIQSTHSENITMEGFVYFQKPDFKAKTLNTINLSF